MKKTADTVARYRQIAAEIAGRIASGELREGERISGRSAVAGKYGVSPETARRAFCLLGEAGVISAEKGRGMIVISRENAETFLRQFEEQLDIEDIRGDVIDSIERQKEEMDRLSLSLEKLMNAAGQFHTANPLIPYMIKITGKCRFIGLTVRALQLWQNTGATLVAIKRNGKIILSPGPGAQLLENDLIYFITQDLSDVRMKQYLYAGSV